MDIWKYWHTFVYQKQMMKLINLTEKINQPFSDLEHVTLNKHLNRIGVIAEKTCPLCNYLEETMEHYLFHCPKLADLRVQLLPPLPDIHNTLFCKHTQLKDTCTYRYMSLIRRTKAHELLVL